MRKVAKIVVFLLMVTLFMPAGKVNAAFTVDYQDISTPTYFQAEDTVTFSANTEAKFLYHVGGGKVLEEVCSGTNPYTIKSYTDPVSSKEHRYWSVSYKGYNEFYGMDVIQMDSIVSLPYTAELVQDSLFGATASLDKTVIFPPEDTVTVTITPDETTSFNEPPKVSAIMGDCGAVTLGENGAYTCTITNIVENTIITVTGETAIVPAVTLKDVTIAGKKGEVLTKQNISLDLQNVSFKAPVKGTDATAWLNLPDGLEAVVTEHTDTVLVFEITGTPEKKSNDTISVTFPSEVMASGEALIVEKNDNAKFDIKDEETHKIPETPETPKDPAPTTPVPKTPAPATPPIPPVPEKIVPGNAGSTLAPVTKTSSVPKTGDESAIIALAAAMMLAALAGAAVIKRKKI